MLFIVTAVWKKKVVC